VNGLFEALRTHQEKIRFIQVRHEEAAAFAACGYAKFTGRLGVCIATPGPGGIHLLNGLYDAKCDGQPVLAITGHTFHDLIGTHYQQDVDLDKLFIDVAAYNQRVMGPAHVENVFDEAIKTSLSRRTVSHVTIPKDIQEWPASKERRSSANVSQHSGDVFANSQPLPPDQLIREAAAIIDAGAKTVILTGAGCLGAREELLQVADAAAAPIVKALLGKGAGGFTIEHPDQAETVLRDALAYRGPAIVQAVVDANEPPLPGNISAEQALQFAKSMERGEKDRWEIIKTVLKDKVREVI